MQNQVSFVVGLMELITIRFENLPPRRPLTNPREADRNTIASSFQLIVSHYSHILSSPRNIFLFWTSSPQVSFSLPFGGDVVTGDLLTPVRKAELHPRNKGLRRFTSNLLTTSSTLIPTAKTADFGSLLNSYSLVSGVRPKA